MKEVDKGKWYPQTTNFNKSEKDKDKDKDRERDEDTLQKRMTMDLIK